MAGQSDLKGHLIRTRRYSPGLDDVRKATRGVDKVEASGEQIRKFVGKHRDETSPVTGKRLSTEETRLRELD